MPDIFDQISTGTTATAPKPQAAPKGDIFDQIALESPSQPAQQSASPKRDIFDELDVAPAISQQAGQAVDSSGSTALAEVAPAAPTVSAPGRTVPAPPAPAQPAVPQAPAPAPAGPWSISGVPGAQPRELNVGERFLEEQQTDRERQRRQGMEARREAREADLDLSRMIRHTLLGEDADQQLQRLIHKDRKAYFATLDQLRDSEAAMRKGLGLPPRPGTAERKAWDDQQQQMAQQRAAEAQERLRRTIEANIHQLRRTRTGENLLQNIIAQLYGAGAGDRADTFIRAVNRGTLDMVGSAIPETLAMALDATGARDSASSLRGWAAVARQATQDMRLRPEPKLEESVFDKPDLLLDVDWYLNVLGEQTPIIGSMLASAGTAGVAARGLSLGARGVAGAQRLAGLSAAFGFEAGSHLVRMRDELIARGWDPERAQQAAEMESVVYGVIASGLEFLPLDKFLRGNRMGRASLTGIIRRGLAQAPQEGITETVQEMTGDIAALLGVRGDPIAVENIKRWLEAGLQGAVVGGGAVVVGSVAQGGEAAPVSVPQPAAKPGRIEVETRDGVQEVYVEPTDPQKEAGEPEQAVPDEAVPAELPQEREALERLRQAQQQQTERTPDAQEAAPPQVTTEPVTEAPQVRRAEDAARGEGGVRGTGEGRAVAVPGRGGEAEVEQRQPWQMTREEWLDDTAARRADAIAAGVQGPFVQKVRGKGKRAKVVHVPTNPDNQQVYDYSTTFHRAVVEKALREGQPVPAAVLADYPDLQATQPAATPEGEPQAATPETSQAPQSQAGRPQPTQHQAPRPTPREGAAPATEQAAPRTDIESREGSSADDITSRQPWDMTSDERALEVERLRDQFRSELATPLMSEGSLSPAQLGRMSQKQRAKYQRDAQTRMRVEAQIRELQKSDDELAKDRQSAIRKKAKSELSQLSRRVKDLSRVGVSGKTGKIRPTYQRQIEQAQARIAEIEAAHPDLASPPKAVPDTSLPTLTRRGNRVYVENAPESMEAALRAAGAKKMKDGRWIAGSSKEAALRDVVEGRAESGEKAESPEAAAEKEAGREIDLTDAAEPFFAAQREIESKIMDIARRSKSRRGVLDMNEAVRFVSSSRSREAKNLIAQRKAIINAVIKLEDAAEAGGKVPSARVAELADLLQASRNIRITLPEPTAGRPGDSGVPGDVRVSGGNENALAARIERARQSSDKKTLRQIAQEQGVEVGPQDTAEVIAEKVQKAIEDKPGTGRGESGAVGSPVRALADPAPGKERKDFQEVPRIPPAPITGGEPKKLSEIVFDAGKRFGRAVKRAKTGGRFSGTYFPSSGRIVIRYAGDLDTTAHELSHFLDDQHQIVPDLFTAKPNKKGVVQRRLTELGKSMRGELESFWQHGSVTQSGPRSRLDYKLGEALAEWGRAYLVNPDATRQQAPKLTNYVLSKLPAETRNSLTELSNEIRQWAGLSGIEKTLSNVQMKEPLTKLQARLRDALHDSGLVFQTRWQDRLSATFTDSLAPVWRAINTAKDIRGIRKINPKSDPSVLFRLFAGFNDKFEDQLNLGPLNYKAWNEGRIERAKGAGNLQWLAAPLDTSTMQALEQDQRLVVAQLISERIVERAEVMDKRSFNDIARKIEIFADKLQGRIESGNVADEDQAVKLHVKLTSTLSKAKVSLGDVPFARKLALIASELRDTPFGRLAEKAIQENAQRKQRMAGIGGGLQSDLGVAKETLAELDKLAPDHRERINEAARRYREWADAMILRPLRDSGRISDEQYKAIKEDNQFYVNMQRVMEGAELPVARTSSRRLGTSKKAIQKFQGSTRAIENPYVSLLSHAFLAQREADLNRAKLAFRNLLTGTRGMYQGKPIDLSSIGAKARQGDENTITVYVDGKPEYWQLEKGVYLAMQNWGEISGNTALEAVMQFAPKMLRTAITHDPGFITRNMIRDATNRGIISRVGSKPWDIFQGYSAQELSQFRVAGAGQFGHYMSSQFDYYRRLRRELRSLAEDKSNIILMPGRAMRGVHRVAASSEIINRMAEFRKTVQKARESGMDDVDAALTAALESRDLLDFAVAGTFVRELNKYIPFTNAAVQGLRRSVQAARENPHQFAIRWSMYALLPTIVAYAWNAIDDEREEEYQSLPDYQRDLFWNFKVGPNLWVRIPKPFELGVMASGAERLIDSIRGKENAFDGFGGSVAHASLPVDETALAGPLRVPVEMMFNHNMMLDAPIVPRHEEDIPVEFRKGTDKASRFGQMLQSMTGDGVDARMIDHFIRGQFGGLGRLGLRLTDIGDGNSDRTRDMNLAIGLMATAPAGSAKEVRRAYELAGSLRLGSSKPVQALTDALHKHRDATTQQAKDSAAKRVRETARMVLSYLEKRKPGAEAKMRAQAGR